jgi:hypothetical protein
MRSGAALLVLAALASSAGRASAEPTAGDRLRGFLERAARLLDEAVAARRPVPPRPVAVRFRDRRLMAIDLGAPLLAVAAGSLDGDERAELVALTAAEVVVLRLTATDGSVLARHRLPGPAAAPRPRDPVGTLVLRRTAGEVEIVARSSDLAEGVVLALERGALVERGRVAGFPLCGGRAELVPGLNHFAPDRVSWDGASAIELPAAFAAATCFAGLVDPRGYPIEAAGAVDLDGRLHLRCAGRDGPCEPPVAGPIDDAGYAFAVIDLDRDGRPELALARASAPGELDEVRVLGRKNGAAHPLHRRRFHGGVVGLVAADADGDGADELIVAVRFFGSTQVTLWRLN